MATYRDATHLNFQLRVLGGNESVGFKDAPQLEYLPSKLNVNVIDMMFRISLHLPGDLVGLLLPAGVLLPSPCSKYFHLR